MKEKFSKKLSRVTRSIVNAILGDGVIASTEHVRRVRRTNLPDTNC
jgi:hypothetical protein